MSKDDIATNLITWIGTAIRMQSSHDEDFRNARVELRYKENKDGIKKNHEIVLTLANGEAYSMKINEYKVDLVNTLEADGWGKTGKPSEPLENMN